MKKLSVIIPYVNEWPALAFTIRSLAEQLIDEIDFEIILIDNYCGEVEKQGISPDRGHDGLVDWEKPQISHFYEVSKKHEWLKYLKYEHKLSHWNSKNAGVSASEGDILLFLDAHVVSSKNYIINMYNYYRKNSTLLNGTLHAVLAYHILENKRLIYSLKSNIDDGFLDYRFSSCNVPEGIIEVPCMSTCGMMMSRDVYKKLNGWPSFLGIYGGGENYINYVMAVLGLEKYVYNVNNGTLFHHGDKRNYSWNYNDYHRNKLIATYLFGGKKWARRYSKHCFKGDRSIIDQIYSNVIKLNENRREDIKKNQVISIEDWLRSWT